MSEKQRQTLKVSAQASLELHLANGFAAWVVGDVLGRHIAWRGAKRCAHVLKLLN